MSAGAVPGLPDDPLVEILSRVPAKSVCRFKFVSKSWRDLITDPDHRKKLRQAMRGLFVGTYEVDKTKMSLVNFSLSFIDLTVRSVPLDIDPFFSFMTEMAGIETFIFDSCNGLILFEQRQEQSDELDGYIVCNPTTRQWSAVPACSFRAAYHHTYLAFDPAVSSHFHLVQFQMPYVYGDVVSSARRIYVYSSETGTLNQNQIDEHKEQAQLEGWHHQFTLEAMYPKCAFVNGFLHLIARGSDRTHILAVDVKGKKGRRMITAPGIICYVGQSQGHLHCVTLESADEKNEKISIWVLQDYDTQDWVLKDAMQLSIFGESCPRILPKFQVVDIHQDRNVVFFFLSLSCNYKLTAYDMDHKEVSIIATFKDYKSLSDFARYVPYFSESPALTNKY